MLPVGICAYFLSEMKFPLAPLVIGLVLGSMADESLRRALMLSDGSFWPLFDRPVAVILLMIIVCFCAIQIPLVRRGVTAFVSRFFRRTNRE